jgi:hypothetical protein
MSNYYARYVAGDCEAVWRELVDHGEAVRDPSIWPDTVSVASELVDRAYRNLRLLWKRLVELGYLFEHPGDAFVEASAGDLATLDSVESRMGVLPVVVRKWYERIGSVDFSQEQAQLFSKGDLPCVEVSGLGLNAPLVFFSLPKCLLMQKQLCDEKRISKEEADHFLPLGGWASNCDPTGLQLPCESFDGVLFNDGGGDVHFVEQLRMAFQWGGFPLWQLLVPGKKRAWPIRCVPRFDKLLPILTEGLTPI